MKKWALSLTIFALAFVVVSVFASTIYEFKSDVYKESMSNLVSNMKVITANVVLVPQSGVGGGGQGGGQTGNCVIQHPYEPYNFWSNTIQINSPTDDYTCANSWGVAYLRSHTAPTGCASFPVTESFVTYTRPIGIGNTYGRIYLQTSECTGVSGYVQNQDAPYQIHINGMTGDVSDFVVIPMCGVANSTSFVPFGYSGEGYPQPVNLANCGQSCITGTIAYYVHPMFDKADTGNYNMCW